MKETDNSGLESEYNLNISQNLNFGKKSSNGLSILLFCTFCLIIVSFHRSKVWFLDDDEILDYYLSPSWLIIDFVLLLVFLIQFAAIFMISSDLRKLKMQLQLDFQSQVNNVGVLENLISEVNDKLISQKNNISERETENRSNSITNDHPTEWTDSEGYEWKKSNDVLFWWNGSEWVKHE